MRPDPYRLGRVLILARHGESEWNARGVLLGRSDPSLTPLGIRQAEALAEVLSSLHLRDPVLVTSPLRRAVDTAAVVSKRLGIESAIEDSLVELDYGELEGRLPSDIREELWARWRGDSSWKPAGGESLDDVQERVSAFCEAAADMAAESDVVAVSHVSPIKAAACWALGSSPSLSWRLHLGVASLTRIATRPRALQSFGETAFLPH